MTTRPWCSDACRSNGGWLLSEVDGRPVGRCRCRLDPAVVAAADADVAAARARRARYERDEETHIESGDSA